MPFATEIDGMNVILLPSTTNRPSGDSPFTVRIDTVPKSTVLLAICWLKVKPRRWFSAIRVTRQPVDVQPRSQDWRQNAALSVHRVVGEMPPPAVVESEDEPPEQPARNSADNPLRTTIDRENRLMRRSIGRTAARATMRWIRVGMDDPTRRGR